MCRRGRLGSLGSGRQEAVDEDKPTAPADPAVSPGNRGRRPRDNNPGGGPNVGVPVGVDSEPGPSRMGPPLPRPAPASAHVGLLSLIRTRCLPLRPRLSDVQKRPSRTGPRRASDPAPTRAQPLQCPEESSVRRPGLFEGAGMQIERLCSRVSRVCGRVPVCRFGAVSGGPWTAKIGGRRAAKMGRTLRVLVLYATSAGKALRPHFGRTGRAVPRLEGLVRPKVAHKRTPPP